MGVVQMKRDTESDMGRVETQEVHCASASSAISS